MVSRCAFGIGRGMPPFRLGKHISLGRVPGLHSLSSASGTHCQHLSPALTKGAGKHSSLSLMMFWSQFCSQLNTWICRQCLLPGLCRAYTGIILSCFIPVSSRLLRAAEKQQRSDSSPACAGRLLQGELRGDPSPVLLQLPQPRLQGQ